MPKKLSMQSGKFGENNNTWYYNVCRFKKGVTFLEIYHSPQNRHTMTIK